MFSIQSDPARKLVRAKIVGFLTTADVRDFYRQEHAAVVAMGCKLGEHLALVDLTECALQVQEVAALFAQEIHSAAKARKLALVTGSSAVKMQARRILTRSAAGLFATVDSAEEWLFGDDDLVGAGRSSQGRHTAPAAAVHIGS